MRTFGDEDIFAEKLHARLIVGLMRSVLGNAHDAGDHAPDRAIVAVENFRAGKARIDFDAERFRLLRQPAADIAERDGIIAVIVHERRHQHIGKPERPRRAQHIEAVFSHGRVEGGALLLPVGNELVEGDRIDDGARQNMGADLGALFENADGNFGRELLEADGGGEAGRAGTHDHHIILHRLALHLFHSPSPAYASPVAPVIVPARPQTSRQLGHAAEAKRHDSRRGRRGARPGLSRWEPTRSISETAIDRFAASMPKLAAPAPPPPPKPHGCLGRCGRRCAGNRRSLSESRRSRRGAHRLRCLPA